ncbi:MAG: glycosyltransferase family 4 protein [Candidatus Omnitrophota bacterium]
MEKKIKLLFATHLFYPAVGGVEIHLKHLTEGLAKRGYPVDVVTTNAYSTEAFFLGDQRRIETDHETVDGVQVERLGFQTFGRRTLRFLARVACRITYPLSHRIRMLSLGPRSFRFTRRIMAHDPDVIIASPLPNMNIYFAAKAARRLNKPLIVISCYHIFDRCCFYNPIFFNILRQADRVIPHTAIEGDYLAQEGRIDPSKIMPLPPFPLTENRLLPELKDKTLLRNQYGIREKYVVLYLGQHGMHKKVNLVLDAMAVVWQAVRDTALVIAGGATGYTPKMKREAEKMKARYGGNVYFFDNFKPEQKDDIFQLSDIFISLSEMESFGIVFVEAMNNGLPVIASKNSVTRLLAEEMETGIQVEPRSVTEVAGAIIELLTDETMRHRFSKNAREKAFTQYHPQKLLDQWEELLSDVAHH